MCARVCECVCVCALQHACPMHRLPFPYEANVLRLNRTRPREHAAVHLSMHLQPLDPTPSCSSAREPTITKNHITGTHIPFNQVSTPSRSFLTIVFCPVFIVLQGMISFFDLQYPKQEVVHATVSSASCFCDRTSSGRRSKGQGAQRNLLANKTLSNNENFIECISPKFCDPLFHPNFFLISKLFSSFMALEQQKATTGLFCFHFPETKAFTGPHNEFHFLCYITKASASALESNEAPNTQKSQNIWGRQMGKTNSICTLYPTGYESLHLPSNSSQPLSPQANPNNP